MKDTIKLILGLLAVTTIVIGCVWLYAYRFNDCLRVGHSTLYCITNE